MAKAAENMAALLEKQAVLLTSSGLIHEAARVKEEARQLRLFAVIEQS
jgi:hypothetical protein